MILISFVSSCESAFSTSSSSLHFCCYQISLATLPLSIISASSAHLSPPLTSPTILHQLTLWLSSPSDQAILNSFTHLEPSTSLSKLEAQPTAKMVNWTPELISKFLLTTLQQISPQITRETWKKVADVMGDDISAEACR